jgi:hypothetical protein
MSYKSCLRRILCFHAVLRLKSCFSLSFFLLTQVFAACISNLILFSFTSNYYNILYASLFRQQTGLVDLDIVCEGHFIKGTVDTTSSSLYVNNVFIVYSSFF